MFICIHVSNVAHKFAFQHNLMNVLFPFFQTPTKLNTKCLEKNFKTDVFLLYYLRDNFKALKILQKELFSIGCTVEFKFDEEEAVVRGDTESHPGGRPAEKADLQPPRSELHLLSCVQAKNDQNSTA